MAAQSEEADMRALMDFTWAVALFTLGAALILGGGH
jgi:hypothetical protein